MAKQKKLSIRWKEFNINEFVESVVDGKQNPETLAEAKNLINETVKNRDKETQEW